MLQLISHIVRTSSKRDRTEINAALVDAMYDLFRPDSLTIYRCYSSGRKTVVCRCAGIGSNGPFVYNAYLPDRRYCRSIEEDPLLKRCKQERSITLDVLPDGANRLAFPVIQLEHLVYIIDVTVPEDFSADQRVLLMGMAEYFGNHIALLDYGETDTLTRLANRKTFDKHLFELLGRASGDKDLWNPAGTGHLRRSMAGENSAHWLAVCDIDRFKNINDTYGHLIGDEVLVVLAQVMRDSFRFDDQLFRFGGEEFVLVLQPASQENASKALDRFRANIERQQFSRVGQITVSIGFSQLRPDDTPADVIDRADEALYFSKGNGRNQIAMYEQLLRDNKLKAKNVQKGEVELF